MNLSVIDICVFVCYCLLILGIGLYVSRNKKGQKKDSSDYFLAGRGLAWWAIGASIIASNISAEQFIGMSGSGYAIGLAMATYEWIAALGLIIVAKWFLPIFLQKRIYTMPQFLEQRFDGRVKTVMAIFWMAVFIFINLTSIMYLGALTIEKVMGIPLIYSVLFLALFAGVYSIYGGLKAVAITDVVQVVFMVGGGLVTTFIAIKVLGNGDGLLKGFSNLYETSSDRFHLILDSSHPGYMDLPGLSVIIGGLWVANLYYWGCNQYIIQRALAAKSVNEAQKGMQFAGLLKLLLPLIVVIPGIAVYAMGVELEKSDEAYPWLLSHLIPTGIKGLAFAALIAAIVSSLATMMNSISTIFTMDIYKPYIEKAATERKLVKVGRLCSFAALVIAIVIAPMLTSLDQAFQYIQEFTGFISPGALAIFLAGFFYKKATSNGALLAAIGTFIFSAAMKFAFPGLPWMDRMLIVFFLCALTILLTAKLERRGVSEKAIVLTPGLFKTSRTFNIVAFVIMAILVVFYVLWW
jgi:SSS family solute:Na+ symporter